MKCPQLGNRVVERVRELPELPRPTPPLSQASFWRDFKDDMNGFFPTLVICFPYIIPHVHPFLLFYLMEIKIWNSTGCKHFVYGVVFFINSFDVFL
jgi:hypothetical protein